MWSILLVTKGDIINLGTYNSVDDCDAAALQFQIDGKFDVRFQSVYAISPDHRLYPYDSNYLGVI